MTRWNDDNVLAVEVRVPKRYEHSDANDPLWVRNELFCTLQSAILSTAAGRTLGDSAQRSLLDSILSAIGYGDMDTDEDYENPMIGGDARLLTAVKALLDWKPEGGYSQNFGEFAIKDEDSKYYFDENTAEGYQALVDAPDVRRAQKNGEPTTEVYEGQNGRKYTRYIVDGNPMPLLSQPIVYPILGGKHDGRSLMGAVRELREAAGLETD